jgi:hypothetical protein
MVNDDGSKTLRLVRSSIPKAGKCWTPPKSKLKRPISVASTAPKPALNLEFRSLQLARKSYIPPSPKRKRPRIEQKPKKASSLLNRLAGLTSSPSVPLLPKSNISSNSIDENVDDGSCSGFTSFGNDDNCDYSSQSESSCEDDPDLSEAISQIELQQSLQLPAYRDLLIWNVESCAQLTSHCYIIQDWKSKEKALQVEISRSVALIGREENIDMFSEQLMWMDWRKCPAIAEKERRIEYRQLVFICN